MASAITNYMVLMILLGEIFIRIEAGNKGCVQSARDFFSHTPSEANHAHFWVFYRDHSNVASLLVSRTVRKPLLSRS